MEERRMPLIGEKFPELEAQTTQGRLKLPDAFKGKWFVLFSHPADFTPVCTTEFVAFQKRYEEFKKLGCELIGLSIDQVFSHIKWVEWIKEKLGIEIQFPIIADDLGKVAGTLGLEILRMVRGFQVSDAEDVAIPANWPENELIGDEVIIPPASDIKTAAERPKQYKCYDWWFCHKKL